MSSLTLPILYRAWMDEALGQPVFAEPRATCDSCVMCTKPEMPAIGDYYFNPNTKCCAFHPTLPNFLVGGILADNDPAYAEAKDQFVRGALASVIRPISIGPSFTSRLVYILKPFGKHEQVLCPYYREGRCAIWKYREAHCSTFFCKHERGARGFDFWHKLDDMLFFVQGVLSNYCVEKLGLVIPKYSASLREAVWGNWAFREAEFFVSCWQIVCKLSWNEIIKIGGSRLETFTAELKTAFNATMSSKVAQMLRASNFTSEELRDGMVRVWTYSRFNPLDLQKEVVNILSYFDGRPVPEVIRQIQNESGLQIDHTLLVKLTDYKILVPAD